MIKPSLFGAFALTFLPACPLLSVEADVSEACMTKDVDVEGATGSRIQSTFSYDDLGQFHDLATLDGELEFVRGEARVTSGIADFSWVKSARLTLASGDPESTLPTLTVHACDGDCMADGAMLELPGDDDVIEYLKGDSIAAGVDLVGELPTNAWSMQVDVCMKGHFKVETGF